MSSSQSYISCVFETIVRLVVVAVMYGVQQWIYVPLGQYGYSAMVASVDFALDSAGVEPSLDLSSMIWTLSSVVCGVAVCMATVATERKAFECVDRHFKVVNEKDE